MKVLAALFLLASVAGAQDPPGAPADARFLLRIHAADTTRQAEMSIDIDGAAFASLGAVREYPGELHLGPGSHGTGTGTVVGSLYARPGRLLFASRNGLDLELTVSPVGNAQRQQLVARGRTVIVAYNAAGELSVATKP